MGADTGGRAFELVAMYVVAVCLGMVRTEDFRTLGRVVGETSFPGGVLEFAWPSSQGSLWSVVPGASFVDCAVRLLDS